jgi:hypothetical protein
MRIVPIIVLIIVLAAVIGALLPAGAALARQKTSAQAVPQSPDALYLYCRNAIFRKYGRNSGDGRLVVDRTRMVENVDLCVRNGGRI